MGFTVAQMADLIASTLPKIERRNWTELGPQLTDYVAAKRLFAEHKVKKDGGTSLQWKVRPNIGAHARWVKPYDQDVVNVGTDVLTADVPWRHSNTNWLIELHEVAINGASAEKILDLIQLRRTEAMISQIEQMEVAFWTKPPASTDELMPYGLEYWLVKEASTTGKFTTNLPAGGWSNVGGIVPATYTRWSNWTAEYTSVSKDNLIVLLRKAMEYTDFQPPVDFPDLTGPTQKVLYTDVPTRLSLEQLAEQQNDNLGNDLDSKHGVTMIRGCPVASAPQLLTAGVLMGKGPIYGIDWGTFEVVFLEGFDGVESKPMVNPLGHLQVITHVDSSLNFRCLNRRKNFVLATA